MILVKRKSSSILVKRIHNVQNVKENIKKFREIDFTKKNIWKATCTCVLLLLTCAFCMKVNFVFVYFLQIGVYVL